MIILFCCYPLEILRPVIKFVSIYVVNLWFVFWIIDKLASHKPMCTYAPIGLIEI